MSDDTSSLDGEVKRRNYAGNPNYFEHELTTVYGGERTRREKTHQTRLVRALTDGLEVVYAIRLGDGTIKIGHTANLGNRVGDYRPQGGDLMAFMPGGRVEERAIHVSLRRHLKRGREWYHPPPEVMAVVNEMRDHYGLPHVAA